ncbi:DALR anticodon-binding domain-containing 3 [Pelobates cultripes]|uniref:DALR anticodon-binding domain-containing 3 n=1 Tax=Pelobates cultripes TaxID=61616 RepID=A0AAD1SYE9_PELCU|nr:DALR anticodon-binding domain-containing 3 [Pelobates cultripes]
MATKTTRSLASHPVPVGDRFVKSYDGHFPPGRRSWCRKVPGCCSGVTMETGCCCAEPLWISEALRALSVVMQSAGTPSMVWFKESSQRNLKSRDFLVPNGALKKSFPDGKVPEELIQKLSSLNGRGVPPIQRCLQNEAGLVIQLDRTAVFHRVLSDFSPYLKHAPVASDNEPNIVILNCVPLHSWEGLNTFKLSHLRAVLVADHFAELLRLRGQKVHLIPAVHNRELLVFLQQFGVSWPSASDALSTEEAVSHFEQYLKQSVYSSDSDTNQKELPPSVLYNVRLKPFAEKHNLCLEGYDPNLDTFLVSKHETRMKTCSCPLEDEMNYTMVHIVSCEDEFHQQKLDLLWRILDPRARAVLQKHLICGPVKLLNPSMLVSCPQYFQIRKSQMHEASVMKYGEVVQGNSWDEIINSLTSAAIHFEMMSTPHRSQVTLDLEDANITTKGTKSGSFVMYNCARLATMFESYNNAVTQGSYPTFPPSGDINYSTLTEEGEWLLLFNYIMTFPEVLTHSAQISLASPGIRVTANTEAVCKFLVNLSMDFSSYYNRVHILGEPLPHLFQQMFARLQLMKAIQSILCSALGSLHIPPLTQI